ncbi:type II secretion system protein [Halorubrum ezzemoulense]|uniref:type II secretion system protein n=1 Tax=Halorubrum ezzemoulense TaxID=337243 RepID=UPI00232ADCD3|nr:type II secretion system protein [Halorubrum ezzemoulense]MDB9249322.1 type II secretion system protein [Halorubrum ezzemoulense]MDB9259522.1 type II secretion system protein [Halorubrum ezzemoulense]MDB9262988.1 type II secretion system protein [Halorubrum ezzemoulense]MDB9266582.1 type II secretion system protein [Halorubrum ezzemoulense]MDB9269883.1 type II secretion system protein [Halorubrum ezzemoulense]
MNEDRSKPTERSARVDGEDDATASKELRRAVAFLGWGVSAERVVAIGYRAGVVVGAVVAAAAALAAGAVVAAPAGLAAAVGGVHAVHRAPVWLASLRRTRALGAAPGLVGRLVLRMRLDPSTERAVRFAGRTGEGPLAAALSRHERGCADGPTSGLRAFAREWTPWFPAIDRAAALVRTAATAPPERRRRCLDRALDATLSGTTDRLASFVGSVRGPVSALYAFGVLLPLALIALLPAGAAAGVAVGSGLVAGLYLIALPGGLVAASAWLLSRRPVAFPPPQIGGDHPDVPDRRGHALVVGCALGAAAAAVAARVVAPWAWPVAGVGVGVGSALFVLARPRRAVLSEVRGVEQGLPDAMTVIGGDVAEGVAVETAVANAGERLDGATGEVFERAGRRSDTLRVGVREAFLGQGGPAADVPSSRVRGAIALLSVAAREGRPAGDVLLELADQLESLRELERDARRQLATVTGTLSNTAAVFAPLVGGATVALATGIDAADVGSLGAGAAAGADALGGGGLGAESGVAAGGSGAASDGARTGGTAALSVPVLGRIVGTYVLLLAALLTGLATGLERGFDRTLVAYRVGIALPTATATFLVAFAGAGLLF